MNLQLIECIMKPKPHPLRSEPIDYVSKSSSSQIQPKNVYKWTRQYEAIYKWTEYWIEFSFSDCFLLLHFTPHAQQEVEEITIN